MKVQRFVAATDNDRQDEAYTEQFCQIRDDVMRNRPSKAKIGMIL
jgi:hypothetical protein